MYLYLCVSNVRVVFNGSAHKVYALCSIHSRAAQKGGVAVRFVHADAGISLVQHCAVAAEDWTNGRRVTANLFRFSQSRMWKSG